MDTTDRTPTTATTTTTTTDTTPRRPSRKGLGFGLTAGLVGGSLAGLAFGVPGISSAAGDTGGGIVALVQQTDEPADTIDTTDERHEAGERLRELLQDLVDDGTLTADQADAVTTHLVENRPERGDHGGDRGDRRGPGGAWRSTAVLDLLGIDAETLRDELRSGSTLLEVAEANGVSAEELTTALVDEATERLDQAVENGRLTDEEAAERLASIEEKIAERITATRDAD